jgi:hypothetical protein
MTLHYLLVTATNSRMVVETFDPTGKRFDAFSVAP